VLAEKTAGARDGYNRAAMLVRHLVTSWNAATGREDATLADAARARADAPTQLRAIARDSATPAFSAEALGNRLEQFLLESFELIPQAAALLAGGDLTALGAVVDRSQDAAERWLGNQIPETIALARLARSLGATAASAFGAGFGGSVWALLPVGEAHHFAQEWAHAYGTQFPDAAARAIFFVSPAGPGANQF